MDLTLGEEDRITGKTVSDLVEQAEAAIVKQERELRIKEQDAHQTYVSRSEEEIHKLHEERKSLLEDFASAVEARRDAATPDSLLGLVTQEDTVPRTPTSPACKR